MDNHKAQNDRLAKALLTRLKRVPRQICDHKHPPVPALPKVPGHSDDLPIPLADRTVHSKRG